MAASPKIQVLPEYIANRIAAGEIIERPASVVRELLDNAVDAGADRIDIEIRGGGRALIAVRDNGIGIDADGMLLAFERHATSKIKNLDDLDAIQTLGFRGEALPSIASVSKVVMESLAEGADIGTRLIIEGGTIRSVEPTACRPGTYIQVKSLFYNVPARRKFLRSTRTEYGHVLETVIDHALTYPAIHFIFRDGDRTVIDAPAVDRWAPRFRRLFGESWLDGMLPISGNTGIYILSGYISEPSNIRSTARSQRIYVNGRRVRDRIITQAVYAAYREYLTAHGHPVFVLKLDLHPDQVDVNVHPAKSEVRFRDPNAVYTFINKQIHEALGGSVHRILAPRKPEISAPERYEASAVPHQSNTGTSHEPPPPVSADGAALPPVRESGALPAVADTVAGAAADRKESTPQQISLPSVPEKRPWRIIGQAFNTFILLEMNGELLVIDQHTAHERVLFERFKAAYEARNIPCQSLLFPVPVELEHRQSDVIEACLDMLRDMGVGVERFGGNTFLVRSLPEHLEHDTPERLLRNIADELLAAGVSRRNREAEHRMLVSLSCRRAIKAGDPLTEDQMRHLVEALIEGGIPNACPHGRPVVIRISEQDIRHRFKR